MDTYARRTGPIETEKFFGTSSIFDDVLLVDVRGGKCHDLERFLGNDPKSEGHLILQDLPGVLENVKTSNEGTRAMPHNIFTPQTVKGKHVLDTQTLLTFPGPRALHLSYIA